MEEDPLGNNAPASTSSSSSWFVYGVASCAALNTCSVGFDIGVNSPAGLLIQEDLQLHDWQLELFMGFINLFALWGAATSAWIVAVYGLRAAFGLASLLFLLGIGLVIGSGRQHFGWILAGRTLVGWGIGVAFAATPQYLAEMAPAPLRGTLTSWSEIGCNVGILLGFGAGYACAGDATVTVGVRWRAMVGLGLVFPVLILVLLTCTPLLVESPRWLVKQQRLAEGAQVLQRLYGKQNVTAVQEILEDIQKDLARQVDDERLESLHPRQPWRLGLFVAVSHELCGIDAIQYYLVFILQASGLTLPRQQASWLLALGALKLACLFVASALVDQWGRRPLWLSSVTGMCGALLAIAACFFWFGGNDSGGGGPTVVIGVCLAVYLACFSLGLGPLGWVLPPELFSTAVRSRAVSVTTFANRLTATVMTSTLLSAVNLLNQSWGAYFVLLAVINASIGILAWRYLPETKGQKLEEAAVACR